MTKAIIDWAVLNSSLAVAMALLLIALVIAVLGGISSLWLMPKLTELDTLRTQVSELKTSAHRGAGAADSIADIRTKVAVLGVGLDEIKSQMYSVEIGALKGRLGSLEASRDGEREVLQLKLQTIETSITAALTGMEKLQSRSEEEISRIQSASASVMDTLRKDSRDELVRQSTVERLRLALEQAEQDLQLAQIREQLARISDPLHSEAKARVSAAQARVEALKVQALAAGHVIDSRVTAV